MHLYNPLTTHSHLNRYTISQVSSANIQEPTGKTPELPSVIRRRGSRGRVWTCGWENRKKGLVSKVVNSAEHKHTQVHGMDVSLINDRGWVKDSPYTVKHQPALVRP